MNQSNVLTSQSSTPSTPQPASRLGDAAAILIKYAAHAAPPAVQERLHEEWLADLAPRRGSLSRLRFGVGCVWAAIMIAHEGGPEHVLAGPVPARDPIIVAAGSGGPRRSLSLLNEVALDTPDICDINTTPLIDVMLVLLITLILSLPILTHAVKIELPQVQPPPIVQSEVIDLDIDFDGSVAWNGTPVADFAQLQGYFRTQAQNSSQAEVRIRPNRRVKYDFVARVLASAQRNGMKKVGIVNTMDFTQ